MKSNIESLLKESFAELKKLICKEENSSRIVIPYYRDAQVRYSEQELKQVFLNLLEKKSNYKFSVETPTINVYRFSEEDDDTPKVCKQPTKGYRSAQIDVTVYSSNIKNHIEFKYGQVESNAFPIEKDLLKMIAEDGDTNYFVHYLVTKTDDIRTRVALSEKFSLAIKNIDNNQKTGNGDSKIDNYEEKKKRVFVISQVIVLDSKKVYENIFCLDDVRKNKYE